MISRTRRTWKLKFDCNSTSHQSGTEELHEKHVRAYLGNIQRNVSGNKRRNWEREVSVTADTGHATPPFLTDD